MPKTTTDSQNPEEEMAAGKSKTTGVLPLVNKLQRLGKGVYGKQVGQRLNRQSLKEVERRQQWCPDSWLPQWMHGGTQ